ncbi:MAG: leucine-rich repeat domain-containing protein, partial [Duncaniella sp.]|nr:leucine-rich repeat domain-containing protein [Duncaniella sp.]
FYWAMALTDAAGNIKEFISPVNLWTAGPATNHKFNVSCCVKDAKVREGNTLRLVTSVNKRNWTLVNGAKSDIVAALPALNNQTEVYNLKLNVEGNANISGLPETAVRGMDVTLKITPASAAHRVDLAIDGETIAQAATSVNHSFVVKADSEIDVKVFDPKEGGTVVYTVNAIYPDYSDKLWNAMTADNICANVVVKGATYASDLKLALTQAFAQKTIKKIDLSGLTIVDDPQYADNKANMLPSGMFYNSSAIGQTVPVVEEVILPNGVTRIADAAFQNCANIKEVRLPNGLKSGRVVVGTYASGSPKYGFAIGAGAFSGCTSLTTIYIPGELATENGRKVVNHFNPICTQYGLGQTSGYLADDKMDYSKITIVVPEENASVYRTAYNNMDYGNPWKYFNFNILTENPVYGVNFDASRIATVDPDIDVAKMAVFLGDNVALNSIKAEGKLKLVNPEIKSLVFDNGQPIQPNADGTIDVEFFNPAKDASKAGNHNISVIYTYDLAFTTASELFTVSTPEVVNENEYKSGDMDRTETLAPVLKAVAENSAVKFNLDFHSEHDAALEVHVMDGQQELIADADGSYTVNMTNADKNIHIFAVPTNGATLNADEIASIDPEQTAGITDISLTGSMSDDELAQALNSFPYLENLDLSDLEGELPEGALQGMTSLTTVTLPEVEAITDNMFSGCSSLQSVDIPASVNTVGAGAFEGCSSLTAVRLTGVDEVGDGAFSGCDNLTTITFLVDAAGNAAQQNAPARKPRRAAGVSDKAFDGLNPNCFIVLDEGVNATATGRNVLYTTSGMITETQPDGSTIEREGRIYTASSDVVFTSAYPLAIPHHFTLADGASISLSVENDKWNSLVVPFDVEKITDEAGNAVEVNVYSPKTRNAEGFYLYTLADDADKLESVGAAKANVPYLFHVPEKGEYTFTATGIEVPSTPSAIAVNGSNYNLHATYAEKELPAADTYVLTEDAWAFAPVDTDAETVTVKPNTVYATSPVMVAEIPTELPDADHTTGIDDIEWDGAEITVAVYGNTLVVYSPQDCTEMIYSVDGRAVKALKLNAGRNDFHLDLNGIYIVAGTKVKF